MRNALRIIVRIVGPLMVVAIVPWSPGGTSTTEAGDSVVTTTLDSGTGSFRQALIDAGTNPGPDYITFDSTAFPENSPATIQATANYIVEGDAATQPLTIDGRDAGVIFDFTGVTEGEAAFHFRPNGSLERVNFRDFTIQNFAPEDHHAGHGVEFGGGDITRITDILIDDMIIRGMQQTALNLHSGDSDSLTATQILRNHLEGNGHAGIALSADTMSNVTVQDNDIRENTNVGVEVQAFGQTDNVVVSHNTIVSNGQDAVFVSGQEAAMTTRVTISQNITTDNGGLGINLLGFGNEFEGVTENDAGDADLGPNGLINFPVLSSVATGIIGTACANCIVEIFISDGDPSGHGEGAVYLATGTADAQGDFNIEACANQSASVTATATDASGNTSEFALNYILPARGCDDLLQGDLDCDYDVDSRDVLIVFVYVAEATELSRGPDCPTLGGTGPVAADVGTAGGVVFGDVNCFDDLDLGDGITLLQYIAGVDLTPEPTSGCVPIGQPILF